MRSGIAGVFLQYFQC